VTLDAVLRVVAVVGVPREALDQPLDVLGDIGGDLAEVREVTHGEWREIVERVHERRHLLGDLARTGDRDAAGERRR
jgi:hypothetical protein